MCVLRNLVNIAQIINVVTAAVTPNVCVIRHNNAVTAEKHMKLMSIKTLIKELKRINAPHVFGNRLCVQCVKRQNIVINVTLVTVKSAAPQSIALCI